MISLVGWPKPVKSRSGGCLERSGDGKPTVLMNVATTVNLSQIPNVGNLCRDSETRILRDDTCPALLPHSAVCYQQQHTLKESFDLPSSSSTILTSVPYCVSNIFDTS